MGFIPRKGLTAQWLQQFTSKYLFAINQKDHHTIGMQHPAHTYAPMHICTQLLTISIVSKIWYRYVQSYPAIFQDWYIGFKCIIIENMPHLEHIYTHIYTHVCWAAYIIINQTMCTQCPVCLCMCTSHYWCRILNNDTMIVYYNARHATSYTNALLAEGGTCFLWQDNRQDTYSVALRDRAIKYNGQYNCLKW